MKIISLVFASLVLLTACNSAENEASGFEYTILRPAWFTAVDEVDYETTRKGALLFLREVLQP